MVTYKGNYYSDYNKATYLSKLSVLLITVVDNSSLADGTTSELDRAFLPNTFLNNLELITRNDRNFCEPNLTKRFAKLFLSTEQYLKVELPWLPGSDLYQQFFIEAAFNTDILTVGIEGERINPYYLKLNAKV